MINLILALIVVLPITLIAIRSVFIAFHDTSMPQSMQVRKDLTYTPTVAAIVPCYNEGKVVYDAIKHLRESDYPVDKLNIFPQDDGSQDDSWEWMQKAARDFSGVFPEKNPQNMGKTDSYLRAMERSTSEIILNVDSDTIVNPMTVRYLVACLADERLGIVGTSAGLLNANDNMFTALQAFLWSFYNCFATYMESHFRANQVVGGFAMALRRNLLEEIAPDIRSRNWFGCKVKDGEDRHITHLLLLRGWGNYYEQKAQVRTFAMETYKKYWGQQLRWRRSTLRCFLWAVRTLWHHTGNINGIMLWNLILQCTTLLMVFFLLITFAISNPLAILGVTKYVALVALSCAMVLFFREEMPDIKLTNPFKMLLVVPWGIINVFFLTIVSLLTLDQDAWGNRKKG